MEWAVIGPLPRAHCALTRVLAGRVVGHAGDRPRREVCWHQDEGTHTPALLTARWASFPALQTGVHSAALQGSAQDRLPTSPGTGLRARVGQVPSSGPVSPDAAGRGEGELTGLHGEVT